MSTQQNSQKKIDYALRVRYFRMIAGMSQNELSRRADVDQKLIQFIECGQRKLTLDTAIAISNALDISLDDFLKKEITISI